MDNLAARMAAVFARRSSSPSVLSDAVGVWQMKNYVDGETIRYVANERSAAPPNTLNLFRGSNGVFSHSRYWNCTSCGVTDHFGTLPSGRPSSRMQGGATDWYMLPFGTQSDANRVSFPVGTYTMAITLRCLSGDPTFRTSLGNTEVSHTATGSFARYEVTATFGGPGLSDVVVAALRGKDTETPGDFEFGEIECFVGSADLGPCNTDDSHMYFGRNAASVPNPIFDAGAGDIDLNNPSSGLLQFPDDVDLSNYTAIGLFSCTQTRDDVNGNGTFLSDMVGDTFNMFTIKQGKIASEYAGGFYYYGIGTVGEGRWAPGGMGYQAISHRYDGTMMSTWIDKDKLGEFAGSGTQSVRNLFVGLIGDGGYSGNKLKAVALWDRALSDVELRAAVAELSTGTDLAHAPIYISEGDSISAANWAYGFKYAETSDNRVIPLLIAQGGSRIGALRDAGRVATWTNTQPTPPDKKVVMTVMLGNDLPDYPDHAGSRAAYLADVAAYLDSVRAQGIYVILTTTLPRTTPDFNTERALCNDVMRTWVGTHCDALADMADDPTIDDDAAASDGALWNADGIHPLPDTHSLILDIVQPSLDAYLNS